MRGGWSWLNGYHWRRRESALNSQLSAAVTGIQIRYSCDLAERLPDLSYHGEEINCSDKVNAIAKLITMLLPHNIRLFLWSVLVAQIVAVPRAARSCDQTYKRLC